MASPSQPVHPLRIQKGTPNTSPTKINGSSLPRPLSELAPTEHRRNSPSFHQTTKKMVLQADSSPFQSSPFNASEGNSSPRLFWQGRNPATPKFNAENIFAGRESSPSPTRRSSIERLQKASRVKNSNMFAREQKQEYDPANVSIIERPLAKTQGNAYGGSGIDSVRSSARGTPLGHNRADSKSNIPIYSPFSSPNKTPLKTSVNSAYSPSKEQGSPTKSSLSSRFKSSFDSETGTWSEEQSSDEKHLPPGRILHRHAKSVTFDAAPPQVNEYEMATPDISSIGTGSRENSYDSGEEEDDDSYNRGDSVEQDDSFDASLEDTDKTPVVGPEDWRHMSPGDHNIGALSGDLEDPFEGPEGSPMPDVRPTSAHGRPNGTRTDSLNSNGDHRPLPPLPGMSDFKRSNSSSNTEVVKNSPRDLPSPPLASNTASEVYGLNGGKMSLEDRLKLMMINDEERPKTEMEKQRERRMRRAGARERASQTPEVERSTEVHEDEDTLDDLPGLGTYQLPPRISRESILRKVNGQETGPRESDYNFSSPMPSSSPERLPFIDPDTPLPSTEDSILAADDSVIIKEEPEDDDEDIDVYDIPEMYQQTESRLEDYGEDDLPDQNEAEDASSTPIKSIEIQETISTTTTTITVEQLPTSGSTSPAQDPATVDPVKQTRNGSLPEFAAGLLNNNDFGLSLQSYMTPTPPPPPPKEGEKLQKRMSMIDARSYLQRPETPVDRPMPSSKPEYDGSGWGPEEDEEEEYESGTPDSVIRHPLSETPPRDSPTVSEQIATVRSASGSKLKTRPSATPADLAAMRELRRNVSNEVPSIPPIPQRHRNRPSMSLEPESLEVEETQSDTEVGVDRHSSFKKKSLTLDIGHDIGLSLDRDFDRVMEDQKVAFNLFPSQAPVDSSGHPSAASTFPSSSPYIYTNVTPRKQRGYLMRQNTKLVVATSNDGMSDAFHNTRSAGNSPIKKDRPESWTVEPWNGQQRKNSMHNRANPRKRPVSGPAPPLPGQESNVTGGMISEESIPDSIPEEGGERGRLFVKVIGVKDLDLPLPKNEQTWFSLTLDNGVHCVTTAWLELGRNAPIGQEFELVVPNDLEFQLTLNAKLVKPAPKRVVESPTKSQKISKGSTFSRVFASPKKRKELEMRQREEEERLTHQRQQEAQAKRATVQPTAWDLISPLAAEDGSFGRSYVCLKDHEAKCFGRPYIVDVSCFNEWATEEATHLSSVKSKRGNTVVQRRAPYKVAKLELQLLFVPKPKGATDEDMPKSMNSCIREMKEAELALERNWEGHLSQQGGDCPYWRRRYFKLAGSKLTAYHESTRQPRATINLANASKLIDDRSSLTQKETTGKGGKRRKSGFAEEEEGYMFVEEGFRIRFNNGELIDFYADTSADKEGWMKVLDPCIGKEGESGKRSWCDAVFKHEEALRRKNEPQGTVRKTSRQQQHHQRHKSTVS